MSHDGDMLGDEQWEWLAQQLQQVPKPAVTIIVSSVQVLTSNPVFESWLHFPRSKQRLLQLLQEHEPNHLILLSGDVHHAEIAGNPALEVTSSGLTHTCSTPWWGAVCGWITSQYGSHRSREDLVFTGYNYGMITISWPGAEVQGAEPIVQVGIRNQNGTEVLSSRISKSPVDSLRQAAEVDRLQEGRMRWGLPFLVALCCLSVTAFIWSGNGRA
mmetsp:Transcript_7783/g.12377  ORF Transcript_7783/g.12377 Transcript_7783/m.12377 type:complete len:215 (+) Transcript_7783:652-1296(+)